MDNTATWFESKAKLTPADKNLVYRVVGFLEYASALRNLDELLKRINSEELQAIDSLIKERPEFGVYTNIASRLQAAPSSLISDSSPGQSNRDSRGLDWVMALARVEVAGMLATFTGHPNPFEAVTPSEYEMSAYRQLLLDGSQTHYWALANDPEVQRVAKIEPSTQTLAYIRRLNVAQHFLFASVRSATAELNSAQLAEAMKQKEQLEKLRRVYSDHVSEYLAVMNLSGVEWSTQNVDRNQLLRGCTLQLKHEPAALASGRARIETRDNP